ncbi:MAG: hypothetical protein RLZZ557_2082 [Bacteroidota bacterium]
MKYLVFVLSILFNIALYVVLGTTQILPLPLGSFLNMQEGIWQNAEPVDADFNGNLKLKGISGTVDVYLDERMVPMFSLRRKTTLILFKVICMPSTGYGKWSSRPMQPRVE